MAKIVCCDYYGNAVSNLTQWDTNRVLKIMNWGYDVAPVIHYTNRSQTWGYKYTSTLEDGVVTFEVPNKMLQQTDTALIFIGVPRSGSNGDTDIELETVYKIELPIQKRTKPGDYSASDNSDIIDVAALKVVIETALATAQAEYDEMIEGVDDILDEKLQDIQEEYENEVALLEAMIDNAKDEIDDKYDEKSALLTSQLEAGLTNITNSLNGGSPKGIVTPDNIDEFLAESPSHSEGIYLFTNFESEDDYYSYNNYIAWYNPAATTSTDRFSDPLIAYNNAILSDNSITYAKLAADLKMAAVEDNRTFTHTEDDGEVDKTAMELALAYLETSAAKPGQIVKIEDGTSGKYKVYIIQTNSTSGTGWVQNSTLNTYLGFAGITAGCYIGASLPAIADGDADVDYYIGSSQNGYIHYRFINGAYIPVGGDSYSKSQTYTKEEVNALLAEKMNLADISLDDIAVPKDDEDDIPDVTSDEFEAISVGQIFVCIINEELTYWIKSDDDKFTSIGDTGLKFDTGHIDDEGYLHLTLNDEDIEGFDPFYVGTGGGGGSSAGINLTNVVKPSSIRNGANAVFSFTATETGDQDITVKWYVDNLLIETQPDRASGSSFSFNAKNYLRPSDTSYVKALITSAGGASLTRQWGVTSTAFSLAWGSTISPITLYTANEPVYAVVNVSAQSIAQNDITITVGSYTATKTVVGTKTVTFEIPADKFSTGVNTVSAVMASSADPTDTTDPISYRAVWTPGATTPIVALAKSELSVSQYDTVNIDYLVYDPDHESVTCSIQVGDETPRSITAQRVMQSLPYSPQDYGTKTVTLTYGQVTDTLTLTITQSEYNIGMVTGDNLRYNLDPVGHSNNDADRTSFGNLTFSSGFDWTNGGFISDSDGAAFVIKKGDRVTLPRQLFGDVDGNGKTIDLSFKIKNSDIYDAVAMQELNNGGSKGLILRANEGELRLNNTSGQLFRYCEDNRIDLSINVEELNDQRVMTVWLDGIPSLANTYAANTLVQTENSLVIGSDHCDVWIYAIHIYNTSLTLKDMIQNYIALAPTTAKKVERYQVNDIFSGDVVSKSALHLARPNLAIVTIAADRLPTGKDNSDYVNAAVTIQDGTTTLEIESGAKYKMQGTSSLAYARSACNLDINFKDSGKTYKLSETAIPVNYLNIKVNVASSENANNICAADNYNTYQPYLVPARETAGVRDTVQGRPCAVFFTNTSDNTIWASSQQVLPGQTILYAMGDLCNSKKNLAVFGQDGEGEHYAKGCIEVSGNDTAAQQFRAVSTYNPTDDEWQTTSGGQVSTDYEWRAEPKSADYNEVITAWDDAVAWVVSTNTDAATNADLSQSKTYGGVTYTKDSAEYRLAKFKAELGNYFAVDSLLYHFLYLEYYAALDNVSKNTFYSYEWDTTSNKYLWNICKNYDDDTILGCDNDGVPLTDYGTDFGDKSGARSIFNADNNTIWVNIQQGFASELASLYLTLRGRNAWDAASIINKWDSYQAVRPHAAMALDAYNKYILPYKTKDVTVGTEVKGYDNSYLPRLQGSKTYQRRQFLTYQSRYMDGKYGYYSVSNSIKFRANASAGTTEDFEITAYTKTYVTVIVDNGTTVRHKITKDANDIFKATFENISVHSNATIYITPESMIKSVVPINEINNSTFEAAGAFKLQDLTLGSADVSNTAWNASTGLSVPSPILNNLSIRNITNFSQPLDLSANVELESVETRGTQAGMITLPSYAPLTTINLNACSGIKAIGLNDVTTFTMASGTNLTSIYVENCNSAFNTAMFTYLSAAVGASSSATRRIRMTGINWSLQNTDLLLSIAQNWAGYNELGEEISKPVLEGTVYVPTLRQREKDIFDSVFTSGLTITYGTFIDEHKVTFLDADGSPIMSDGQPYVQWIEYGSSAYEPIEEGEVSEPTKASTEKYSYEFDHWSLYYNGQVSGTAYDFDSVIINDITLIAVYTESLRTFTVNFYNFEGDATPIHTETDVEYGSAVSYDGHTKILYEETTGSPNFVECWMFKQWDKSLGFIRGYNSNGTFMDVINVYGVWEYSKIFKGNGYLLLTDGLGNNKELKDMSFPEIYSVIANNQVDYNNATYTDNGETKSHNFFQQKDYLDITMGSDFTFKELSGEGNLPEDEFVKVDEELYLDGTNAVIPTVSVAQDGTRTVDLTGQSGNPIKLFDEDSPSFTMAIDFQYTPDSANYAPEANDTLVSCFANPDNGNDGFRLYWTSSRPTIQWGDKSQKAAQSQMRDIVVLRHIAGSKDLVVYSFNASTSTDNYYGNTATKVTLTRTADTETDAPLVLGGYAVKNNGVYEVSSSNQAAGIIHWCKIWYDDIGDDIATKVASWTRDHCRMEYFSQTTDNDGSTYTKYASPFILSGTGSTRGNASFIFNNILRYTHTMNSSNTNVNGWAGYYAGSMYNFCQNRILYGLPQLLQLLIKQVKVPATAGNRSTTIANTDSYVYIPSYNEMFGSGSEGRLIPWFPSNTNATPKRLYFYDIIIPPTALTAGGAAKYTTAYSTANDPVLGVGNRLYHANATEAAGLSEASSDVVLLSELPPTSSGDTSKYYYVGNATDGYDLYRFNSSTSTYDRSGVREGDIWQANNATGYIFISSETIKKNNVSVNLKVSLDGIVYGGWKAAVNTWLRSPYTGSTYGFNVVTSNGQSGNTSANGSFGVLPSLTI